MLIGSNTPTDFVRLVMVKSKVAVIAMILVVVIVLVTGQTTPSVDTFACKRSKVKEVFYVMFFL